MVIKKPYAFLIKKFKLIHTILFVLLVYLFVKTYGLFDFFNAYANNNFIATQDLVSSYMSLFQFIACLIVVTISILIFYLFDKKEKPNKIYLISAIEYVLLIILFIVMLVFLQDLEQKTFSYEKVRAIRDIIGIFMVPQIIVAFVVLGRALGFNVKEFDFKKDLDDLEIEEKDYEEVEITLGQENYKYSRAFRKTFRLFKYFVLENRFLVTIICSVVALVVSLVVFLNLRIYNKHYDEKETFVANAIKYEVDNSYLAYKDIRGNIINEGRYYLLIQLSIKNILNTDIDINRDTFKLKVGRNMYSPKFGLKEQFIDVGEAFAKATLKSGESKNIVIMFELDEKDVKNEYMLRVKNASNISIGTLKSQYVDIIIKPKNINKEVDTVKSNIPSNIDLSQTLMSNTSFVVQSVEIADSFKEKYEYCLGEECDIYTYIVRPSGRGNAVLRIKSQVTVDENQYISRFIQYPSNFYKYFSRLYYRYEGVRKELPLNIIESEYGKEEYTYLEVPEKLKDANRIEMLIDIRGVKNVLVLK